MTRLNVDGPRCEALFASELQRSDAPTAESVTEAISRTVRRLAAARTSGSALPGTAGQIDPSTTPATRR